MNLPPPLHPALNPMVHGLWSAFPLSASVLASWGPCWFRVSIFDVQCSMLDVSDPCPSAPPASGAIRCRKVQSGAKSVIRRINVSAVQRFSLSAFLFDPPSSRGRWDPIFCSQLSAFSFGPHGPAFRFPLWLCGTPPTCNLQPSTCNLSVPLVCSPWFLHRTRSAGVLACGFRERPAPGSVFRFGCVELPQPATCNVQPATSQSLWSVVPGSCAAPVAQASSPAGSGSVPLPVLLSALVVRNSPTCNLQRSTCNLSALCRSCAPRNPRQITTNSDKG
jgi:hypothetical protein